MTAYSRWAAGRCPCCGLDLDWWPDADPEAIAEGIMICGRCIVNEHLEFGGLREAMLEAIARRTDAPIERAFDGVRPRPA